MIELKDILEKIEKEKGVLLYFSGENCSVCEVLRPKLAEEFSKEFPKIEQIYLSSKDTPRDIYNHFGIFSFPTILIFLDGKEFFRKSRNLSLIEFIKEVQRPYNILLGE